MTAKQYPAIMYTIHMKRTGVYYVNMFVWPAVILAFLTAFMFLVPPEAGERVHIGKNRDKYIVCYGDLLIAKYAQPEDVGKDSR